MIALDISGAEISVVQLDGRKVVRWGRVSVPSYAISNGRVTDSKVTAEAVRGLLASANIRGRSVSLSLSGLFTVCRTLEIPFALSKRLSDNVVRDALESAVNFSLGPFYLFWCSVGRNQDSRLVLAVAVPRDVLESHVRALREAGLSVRTIELNAFSLARAAGSSNSIILNADSSSYEIVLVRGDSPILMHTATWYSDNITDEDKADKLASAVRLALGRSQNQSENAEIERQFYVTSALAENSLLVQALEERLGSQSVRVSPPVEYPAEFPVSVYAANVGLAMSALSLPRGVAAQGIGVGGEAGSRLNVSPKINLLPNAYRPWKPSLGQSLLYASVSLALVLVVPFFNLVQTEIKSTDATKIRQNEFRVAAERRDLEAAQQTPLKTEISNYEAVIARNGYMVDDLLAVNTIASKLNVQITNLLHNGTSISFVCQAENYLVFRQFISELDGVGRFGHPVIPPEGYPFIRGGAVHLTPKR